MLLVGLTGSNPLAGVPKTELVQLWLHVEVHPFSGIKHHSQSSQLFITPPFLLVFFYFNYFCLFVCFLTISCLYAAVFSCLKMSRTTEEKNIAPTSVYITTIMYALMDWWGRIRTGDNAKVVVNIHSGLVKCLLLPMMWLQMDCTSFLFYFYCYKGTECQSEAAPLYYWWLNRALLHCNCRLEMAVMKARYT